MRLNVAHGTFHCNENRRVLFEFHWSLPLRTILNKSVLLRSVSLRRQFTIRQHRFRICFGAGASASHYGKQLGSSSKFINKRHLRNCWFMAACKTTLLCDKLTYEITNDAIPHLSILLTIGSPLRMKIQTLCSSVCLDDTAISHLSISLASSHLPVFIYLNKSPPENLLFEIMQ